MIFDCTVKYIDFGPNFILDSSKWFPFCEQIVRFVLDSCHLWEITNPKFLLNMSKIIENKPIKMTTEANKLTNDSKGAACV